MTTRDTIQAYFRSLQEKTAWEAYLSEELAFTSHTSPIKQGTRTGCIPHSIKPVYKLIGDILAENIVETLARDQICP